jgi:hypothetical protein
MILKESKEISGTYGLESTERGTTQDTERKKESEQEAHSLSEERREKDK